MKAKNFWLGVRSLFQGFGFIVTKPSVWGWALVPVVIATVIFGAVSTAAIWFVLRQSMVDSAWGDVALKIILSVIAVVAAFLVAITIAQPLAGFALERIARRQHAELNKGGGKAWRTEGMSFLGSLGVSLTALLLSTPIVGVLSVIALVAPPASIVTVPLQFLVTGLAVAWDFLDYPLSLEGMGARARLVFIRRHFGAVLGFGVASALLLLVPGISLFLLPIGVAGATRLVNELADKP